MPSMEEFGQQIIAWVEDNALAVLLWGVALFVLVRLARPIIHRVLVRVIKVPAQADGPDRSNEVTKRVTTLEDVLLRLVKYGVVIAFLILALTIFDLWPVVAGLGIIIAGLAVAGQSIVLDYLTGILLLFEYPFSIGDVVSINGVEGTVEEIGLRRVTVRDVSGTVHTIANGEIRITSNLTRYYANAVVDVVGVPVADVDRAIEVMSAVGAQLAADEAWSAQLLETPEYRATTAFTDLGVTLRMSGRVLPGERWRVASELRRRISQSLAEAGIAPNHRLISPPAPVAPARPAVPPKA